MMHMGFILMPQDFCFLRHSGKLLDTPASAFPSPPPGRHRCKPSLSSDTGEELFEFVSQDVLGHRAEFPPITTGWNKCDSQEKSTACLWVGEATQSQVSAGTPTSELPNSGIHDLGSRVVQRSGLDQICTHMCMGTHMTGRARKPILDITAEHTEPVQFVLEFKALGNFKLNVPSIHFGKEWIG